MLGNSFRPDPNDFIIVVMGPTGCGKSNFINAVTGVVEDRKASSLKSDTQHVVPHSFFTNEGFRVILVDTPGFDDTYRPDSEILRIIADWLTQKYPDGKTLNVAGIIYLHRITDNRMSGSVHKNLQLFGRLCGDLPLHRARLVTTMWDRVKDSGMADGRQEQLTNDFWKPLIDNGAIPAKFHNTTGSARVIVDELTNMGREGNELLLQEELVEQNKRLNETEAAKVLYSRFQQLLAEQKKTLKELADEAKTQNDPSLTRRLEEEYEKINMQLQKTFDEMNEMKISFFRRIILRFFGGRSRAQAVKLDSPVTANSPRNSFLA